MHSPFPPLNTCYLMLLQESYDPKGKHMEYRDGQGALFARMTKVYKESGSSPLLHLFDVFKSAQDVYAELRDAENNLLLTTVSTWGSTKHDCRVDICQPDGTLIARLRDASFGADFTLPNDTLIGTARRPGDRPTEPMEVTHTFADAAGATVGTCARAYPDQSHGLFDFLMNDGVNSTGMPIQTVTLEPDLDPILRTCLLLFPALQNLRYAKSS